MPSFPSCWLSWDTKSPLKRRVEVGGKNMRHSQTFFNELRLMHLEIELHNIANAVSQNNNKILKRFKPNKLAKLWGKILLPNVLHSGVFFLSAQRELHNNKLNYYCESLDKKKKTFKITALQDCAVTVPGGTWYLTEFCFCTTRKS